MYGSSGGMAARSVLGGLYCWGIGWGRKRWGQLPQNWGGSGNQEEAGGCVGGVMEITTPFFQSVFMGETGFYNLPLFFGG